jgi:hypothetical protein
MDTADKKEGAELTVQDRKVLTEYLASMKRVLAGGVTPVTSRCVSSRQLPTVESPAQRSVRAGARKANS